MKNTEKYLLKNKFTLGAPYRKGVENLVHSTVSHN